ncbi:Bifunctional nuclease (BFN) domain profile [Actinomyces succiniciruminis]|uniref:Bifunctional nuclease (BFN) domain profile n=2 Tax=Actinomyces succiniciruminis TaxID=1522002 RepID=A0A1L7RDI9_9ACTO|nr:Bifunctional nuclease (BFN) domain profile [Actinomyces succiniciruminis]
MGVRTMSLMGVRSTAPDSGLVAVLMEDGGPGMITVPVGARDGLLLNAPSHNRPPSWVPFLTACVEAFGSAILRVELDVDADGGLCAAAVLDSAAPGLPKVVPCVPSDALILADVLSLPMLATDALLRLRGIDLGEEALRQRMLRWRRELDGAVSEDA